MNDQLLTARQIVSELQALRLGTWTSDSLRQWIREEPPLPIAEPANMGGSHRYRLIDVLTWLRDRAARERSKGYTRADGLNTLQMFDQALENFARHFSQQTSAPIAAQTIANGARENAINSAQQSPRPASAPAALETRRAIPQAASPVTQLALSAPEPTAAHIAESTQSVSPAKSRSTNFDDVDVEKATDIQLLMEVISGRDPRNWKAAEEALRLRTSRLQAQGNLVPVDDLARALQAQAMAVKSAMTAHRSTLKQTLRDCQNDFERDRAIDEAVDLVLVRMSSGSDLEDATDEAEAEHIE